MVNTWDFANDSFTWGGTTVSSYAAAVTAGYVSFARASSGLANVSGTLTSFATDVPRFNSLKQLLLEGAATNLQTSSEDMTAWTNTSVTVATSGGTDAAVAPDGTTTAEIITVPSGTSTTRIMASPNLTSVSQLYTVSVYLKSISGAQFQQIMFGATNFSGTGYANFDIINGLVTQKGSSTIAAGIENVGNGWFRVWATQQGIAATGPLLQIYTVASGTANRATGTGPGSNLTYAMWGAQVEAANPRTDIPTPVSSFIPTTTASASRAADVLTLKMANGVSKLRVTFDDGSWQMLGVATQSGTIILDVTKLYRPLVAKIETVDPIGTVYDFIADTYNGTSGFSAAVSAGKVTSFSRTASAIFTDSSGAMSSVSGGTIRRNGVRGAMLEAAATNLQTQSGLASGWTATNVTNTVNSGVAPDGTTTASLITRTGSTTVAHTIQGGSITPSNNIPYVFSLFLKASTGSSLVQVVAGSTDFSTAAWINVDCSAGTIVAKGTAVTGSGIQSVGNGWYRCWFGVQSISGTAGVNFLIYGIDTSAAARAATSASDGSAFYAWGAQIESAPGPGITVPSSYIATTSASVTRDADVLTIPLGTGNWTVRATFEDGSRQTIDRLSGTTFALPAVWLQQDYVARLEVYQTTSVVLTTADNATGLWTCPSGVTSIQIEGLGAGGMTVARGASGGGAYGKRMAFPVTPGNTYAFNVAAAATVSGTNALQTWFGSASTVAIDSAVNNTGTASTATAGGLPANGYGCDYGYAGGAGGAGTTQAAGGAGAAAGPLGPGGNGSAANGTTSGSSRAGGGGGANGGNHGTVASASLSGIGGYGPRKSDSGASAGGGGRGSAAAGNPGANGSGGSGGWGSIGGANSHNGEFGTSYGCGSGSGGTASNTATDQAANTSGCYGNGSAGGTAGGGTYASNHADGILVITYIPSSSVDGTGSGATIAETSSPVAGSATGNGSATGATVTLTNTLLAGTASIIVLAPGVTLPVTMQQALDTASGIVVSGGTPTLECHISATGTPTFNGNDNSTAELGEQFRINADGYIWGARFYNPNAEARPIHLFNVFNNTSATPIATATSAAVAGWQDVMFSSPVAVTVAGGDAGNGGYVISYFSGNFAAQLHGNGQYVTFTGQGRGSTTHMTMVDSVFSYTTTTQNPNGNFNTDGYGIAPLFALTNTGSATAAANVGGMTVTSTRSVISAGATGSSGGTNGTAPGTTLSASRSLIAGAATGGAVAPGVTLTVLHTLSAGIARALKTYYFANSGSDANDGLTPATAKQTIAAANALGASGTGVLLPGDTMLFKGGDTFQTHISTGVGTLQWYKSGITVSSYGTGQAIFQTTADEDAIYFEGSDNWVDNVKIVGPGGVSSSASTKSGIVTWPYAGDAGGASRTKITRCDISGFNNGILIGGEIANACDGVIIGGSAGMGNTIYNCKTDAIQIEPSAVANVITNITVSYNICHDTGFNGIDVGANIQTAVVGILVERNVVYTVNTARATINGGSASGIICWAGTNFTARFNEVYGVNASSTGIDGNGIDIECTLGALVEDNYIHGCGGPGLMRYDWTGGTKSQNCTFRFNLVVGCATQSAANYGSVMIGSALGAGAVNDQWYQNTFVATAASTRTFLAVNASPASAVIYNNLFLGNGTVTMKSGTGSITTVDHNLEYNISGSTYGTNVVTTDPLIVSTLVVPTLNGWDASKLGSFQVQTGSPAINAGLDLTTVGITLPANDLYGNALGSQPTNIGAYDGSGAPAAVTGGGVTVSQTESVVAGTASGAGNVTGTTLTETLSLVAGGASGGSTVSGATLTTTGTIVAGSATGTASATGATLTETLSVVAGAASGSATAGGVTVTSSRSVVAGAATAGSTVTGATLAVTISGVFGSAGAGQAGNAPGATVTETGSVIAGGVVVSSNAPGSTVAVTGSVVAGGATVSGSFAGTTVSASRSVVAGAATGNASVTGTTLTETATAIGGGASAQGNGSFGGVTLTETGSLIPGTAKGDASVSGVTLTVGVSAITTGASGANQGNAPGATISVTHSVISGGATGTAAGNGTTLSVAELVLAGAATGGAGATGSTVTQGQSSIPGAGTGAANTNGATISGGRSVVVGGVTVSSTAPGRTLVEQASAITGAAHGDANVPGKTPAILLIQIPGKARSGDALPRPESALLLSS